jgi:hypothetical protein
VHTFIGISSFNVKNFVNYWSNSYPTDLWWRQKHNIAFNSLAHQQSCFIDQLFEYYEEETFREIAKKSDEKKEVYQPGRMNWLKPKVYSQEEIENMFDNIDLDKL